jgi:hypothetical protein
MLARLMLHYLSQLQCGCQQCYRSLLPLVQPAGRRPMVHNPSSIPYGCSSMPRGGYGSCSKYFQPVGRVETGKGRETLSFR